MRVQIFKNPSPRDMTEEVNEWLVKNPNISIIERQFIGVGAGKYHNGSLGLCIWYEEKTEG